MMSSAMRRIFSLSGREPEGWEGPASGTGTGTGTGFGAGACGELERLLLSGGVCVAC